MREEAPSVSASTGLIFEQTFCPTGTDPYDTVVWETRTASIMGIDNTPVFHQEGVVFPKPWSQNATNIVSSKYFAGAIGTEERENSPRQLISRVVDTITSWGFSDGYFEDEASRDAFRNDLSWLCLHQYLAFNSPVWFNIGVGGRRQQSSACYINAVKDSLESILDLTKTEGMLFKGGSGSGADLSKVRSAKERLQGGGTASGPLSFLRGHDAMAGAIKSGGKTRRAARMVTLNADHPDIVEFIDSKAVEEKKAWALIDSGYDGGFNVQGGAYDSVAFQNANHSVRATDEFMQAVLDNTSWDLTARTDGSVLETLPAQKMMQRIAEATYICGDPGMQFDSIINRWHTIPNTGPINSSNPCSEFLHIDDSSCNLASLNLMKFLSPSGEFEVERFAGAARISITAQEILVDRSQYPTEAITQNSHKSRPLGLGYANLGALLMTLGLPYDSDEGRAYAAAVTSLMHGAAYHQSSRLAKVQGSFEYFEANQEEMSRVIGMHAQAHQDRVASNPLSPERISRAASHIWADTLREGAAHGFRNSQVTVLAPCGTISFLMDCDTTGVEPDLFLVKHKKLVGGGTMKIVNQSVHNALLNLGYDNLTVTVIMAWISKNGTVEGCPTLKKEHLPVFDCSLVQEGGTRSIEPMGHLRMLGAVQPFLSGGISKTVNCPSESTVEEIKQLYIEAWKLGVKCVAIYRDGSKRTQPLNTSEDSSSVETPAPPAPKRRRLPNERQAITHKFDIGGHEGYVTVGVYEDGTPGELFITMSKQGSTLSGIMDAFATSISMCLQYGVPIEVLCDKFSHTRYEPSGFTGNSEIPIAKSITDYIFRWFDLRFGASTKPDVLEDTPASVALVQSKNQTDAPPCFVCGSITDRNGSCYKCRNCGTTTGCS